MTTETLMTEAATTTEGQASEQATESTTGVVEGGQEQQSTEGQNTEGQQAAGANTEGEQSGKEAKPEGAPEKYEFQPTEGALPVDPKILEQFADVAKELNLPQDQAQKMIDKVAPVIQARQAEQIAAIQAEWADTAKADKEFGGDALSENLATAKKALDTFGTPELRTLLNDSGMGNHPEVIRFMVRTGKAISEDRFVNGGQGKHSQSGDAKRLYPNSNMN
jgi:hypothetical protein